ncbi:hypothetical protein ACA910_014469 [Epithemia clementina (nom. ined.)]
MVRTTTPGSSDDFRMVHSAMSTPPARIGHSRFMRISRRMALSRDDDDEDDDDEYDDDEENPLGNGVASVSWLPTVVGAKNVQNPQITKPKSEFLPLFPLGGIVYTPNSEHILNIFEPRYRQMYSDILMNGTKRFVVSMSHPTEPGRFAKMGVLFELEDLKEVSEQTRDQIKYVCNHKVTGRVEIHRILNPTAWEKRDTYLRVEGTITDDSGKESKDDDTKKWNDDDEDESTIKLERSLRQAFSELVETQHAMEEDIRFTRASVATLAVKDGPGPMGLWATVKLWQTFADQRLMGRQHELQKEFQERLQAFLKKQRGLKSEDELPSAVGYNELSRDLQQEVKELQQRMAVELQPLVLESTLTMQKILEASNHTERLKLLRCFMQAETKRLNTKRTLQGMFSGNIKLPSPFQSGNSSSGSLFPKEEMVDAAPAAETLKPPKTSPPLPPPTSSIFMDEEDAFQ